MKKITFKLSKKNQNQIFLSQIQNDEEITSRILIPPSYGEKLRIDILTSEKISAGYTYDIDGIIILTENKHRKIYYDYELKLEYDLV